MRESGGADLLLKGAYIHSRGRQMIFGGATRAILDHADLPGLFAHWNSLAAHRGDSCLLSGAEACSPWLPEGYAPDVHHERSLPTQLRLVRYPRLVGDAEGPAVITGATSHNFIPRL